MANLIKVQQMAQRREGRANEYLPDDTALNILKEVFGQGFKLTYSTWQGVRFQAMSKPSMFYSHPLMGIQMSVGDYSDKTMKRVMVKDDTIDADALKAKFAELKAIANDLAKRQKESADYESKSDQLRTKVAKAVSHSDRDILCKVFLYGHSPTEVEMKAKVNGTQLMAIEKLLGEQSAEIRLVVLGDKAVEAYNILRGTEIAKKYKKKTDWICNHCGTVNDVYARHCSCCMEKRRGNEKRL